MADNGVADTRIPAFAVSILGVVGAAALGLLLAPQVYKNWQRQSTEGMSVGMVFMWHIPAIVATGYYSADPVDSSVVWVVASLCLLALLCCLVEAQVLAYRRRRSAKGGGSDGPQALAAILPSTLALSTVTAALMGGCVVLFRTLPQSPKYILGNVVPTVMFVVAFAPQYWEFLSSGSTEGYSFGVTGVDVTGCLANTLVLVAPKSVRLGAALKEAAPFLGCIAAHVVLVAVALFVNLRPSSARASKATASTSGGAAELVAPAAAAGGPRCCPLGGPPGPKPETDFGSLEEARDPQPAPRAD